ARNLYLSNEQSFTRKIRQAYLAQQMDERWSKTRILDEYLNDVPYGAITYGCEAASLLYFSTHRSKLIMWQAATATGLPRAPLADAHKALSDIVNWSDAPVAALVAMDPRNGQVLAMDASVPYGKNQFNFPVSAARQAGSTFKAFTLTAAVSQGIDPYTAKEL